MVYLQIQVVDNAPFEVLLGRPFFDVVSCSENSTASGNHEIRIKDPKTRNIYVFATQPRVRKTPYDSSNTPTPREKCKPSFVDSPAATLSSLFTSHHENLFPTTEPSDPSTSSNFYYQACSFYTPRNPLIITKSPFSNDLFSSNSVSHPSLSPSQVLISVPLQSLVSSTPVSVSKSPSPSMSDAFDSLPISNLYSSEVPNVIPYHVPNPNCVPTSPPVPSSQSLPDYIELKSLSSSTDSPLSSLEPLLPNLSSPAPTAVLNCPNPS